MLLTQSELARHLTAESGRNYSQQNVSDWCSRGVRGVVLPSRMIGGDRLISLAAYHKWQADVEEADRKMRSKKRQRARPVAKGRTRRASLVLA